MSVSLRRPEEEAVVNCKYRMQRVRASRPSIMTLIGICAARRVFGWGVNARRCPRSGFHDREDRNHHGDVDYDVA